MHKIVEHVHAVYQASQISDDVHNARCKYKSDSHNEMLTHNLVSELFQLLWRRRFPKQSMT
jgi:hypothetical protein